MRRALTLAERGTGQVAPNPLVGAVVVRNGVTVGEGFHARYGEAHAEIIALAQASDAARGATLYVTLEPCNHHGKTPPCTEAIIRAGIARVVYAIDDPNPVAGGGADRLRAAGIVVTSGVLAEEAAEQNVVFLHDISGARRPWVTLKLALSIDGAVVGASRTRGWLTGAAARRAVHAMRATSDAIGVGIGTAIADDPELTVRSGKVPRIPPIRIVFDRNAMLPIKSRLAQTAREIPVLVVTGIGNPPREEQLAALGVNIVRAASLDEALVELRTRGVRHLLLEGGAGMASAYVNAGLVDRLVIFQAPVILGAGALHAFSALPARDAGVAPRLRVVSRRSFGDDLMTIYAVSGE